MKKLIWFAGGGALIVGFIVAWFAPRVIGWYFEPPVEIGVNCRAAVEWAMYRLQMIEGGALVIGGLGGFLVGLKFGRKSPEKL